MEWNIMLFNCNSISLNIICNQIIMYLYISGLSHNNNYQQVDRQILNSIPLNSNYTL